MEMGWRVEKRVGRGSQEQLPRGFNRGERRESWRKTEKGREKRSVEKKKA